MTQSRISLLRLTVLVALLAALTGCRRARERFKAPNATATAQEARDVRCMERPEGCIWCEGRGATAQLVDPDAPNASLCNPKDPDDCVDFC